MASYTEKVSLSGTALSLLLYECVNSVNSQEGFLIGDITSELTNHISDSQSDNARLDTQIVIRSVLPLPSISLFYFPTGKIKENVLTDFLSKSATEVVGWYKYRKNTSIKPTFRDRLIAKGLQKYFEKYHAKKTFVTCNLSNKTSSAGSTHTFTYRFGKINCFDMYEHIEDVTANLGEKLTGYKKAHKLPLHSVFNSVVRESNVQSNNTNDAVLCLQEAVHTRLVKEAKIAAKNENTIRELETEIKHMSTILSDKHTMELQTSYNRMVEEKIVNREAEMAQACVEALRTPFKVDILNINNSNTCSKDSKIDHMDSQNCTEIIENSNEPHASNNFVTNSTKPALNFAAALKNNSAIASTSRTNNFTEDLISFDVEDKKTKKTITMNEEVKCLGESSPEY
ncbi:hypothetical protein K1T71_001246 [Dendrolimus kikuchii]|uniref:Uncharacterized protein n=1 Tax=Dendrolimus kikuchii TaxID=765133 RepID=A0ACC1DH85_9NEOP|nr:hypothetical protein K1T71_001246 [Dendrolimus kikuchii]